MSYQEGCFRRVFTEEGGAGGSQLEQQFNLTKYFCAVK